MAELTTHYRPGLRFSVKPGPLGGGKCHQECCYAGKVAVYNHDGTLQQEEIRPLWAEFGVYGNEYQPAGADGEPINDMFDGTPLRFADIRGGFFDLDTQAEEKGWSDGEKEIVARHMLRKLRDPDCLFLLAEERRVAAPWPTYDSTHHKSIPGLAVQLGLAREALVYESQNRKRAEVIEKLRESVAAPVVETVSEDDLVVA